jgi:hypothetical protein
MTFSVIVVGCCHVGPDLIAIDKGLPSGSLLCCALCKLITTQLFDLASAMSYISPAIPLRTAASKQKQDWPQPPRGLS